MSDHEFEFSSTRNAYVLHGPGGDTRFRLIVPIEFVNEEAGADATETGRLDWLRANLPQILQAYTARTGGGRVKAPWDRILVEEVE